MEDNFIPVLDHGYVRLVDHMGGDLSIVRSARVSHDCDWRSGEDTGSDTRLINYLWKNRHTSPFESVAFTFEVMAPIFVFRQWHRHRTWKFNEVSARYTELPSVFYVPDPETIGSQSESNKQARDIGKTPWRRWVEARVVSMWFTLTYWLYRFLLWSGWPRELARCVLPVSIYSRMFATVDLHNLLHFLTLRNHKHSQYEIREYAEAIEMLIEPIIPVAMEAWKNAVNEAAA